MYTEHMTITPTDIPTSIIRELEPGEWHKLTALYERSFPGQTMPQAENATAVVVEDEQGEVRAAMFFQPVFHAEPFCADKGWGTFFPDMVKHLEGVVLKDWPRPLYYYCIAPVNTEQLARELMLGRTVMFQHVPVMATVK